MKVLVPVFVLLLSVGLYSCSKERSFEIPDEPDPAPGTTLPGKWRFINLFIEVESRTYLSDNGITDEFVSRYKDTTTKNSGELNVDATTISAKHAYTVDAYAENKIVINGAELDGIPPTPIQMDVKSETSAAPYIKVAEDSLYFPQGFTFIALDPSAGNNPPPQSDPSGMKYMIRSDTLFLYGNLMQDIRPDLSREIKVRANVTLIYKKQ